MINRLSEGFGKLSFALMLLGCAFLLALLLVICGDVFTRNVFGTGLKWGNEVSEYLLYLMTLCAAPWLLRRGQHIRVDILLRALPGQLAWLLEWVVDLIGVASSLVLVYYGGSTVMDAVRNHATTMKTLVMPEWWLLWPFPAVFLLLAIEFAFRMARLVDAPRAPRDEAVSAA
jgi:TRAP-type C4-dicarboxylate transport system permease small subunit